MWLKREAPPTWRDVGAGLCVAGLLLPEAVAYSGLAHLPVVHALVASIVGLAIYALLGGSRFAIVAPTSSSATLCAAATFSLISTGAGSPEYLAAFFALVLLAGGVLFLLAVAKQGQLSSFVSRPVLRGFAFALAITIVIKQLPDVLGLAVPHTVQGNVLHLLFYVLAHTAAWQLPTLAVALAAAALLWVLRRWPQVPASLVMMMLAVVLAKGFDLHALGVEEVGALYRPDWQWQVPQLPFAEWLRVGEMAFGLVVLIFAESWGSMRNLALKFGDKLDANRELCVLGLCNLVSALLQGMPVGAGFSASSANAAAGASSRWAGVVALGGMGLAIAFALPALNYLPRAVLAVAVISALWHALSLRPLLTVWQMNRDRILIVVAALAVLFFGVLHGMLAAIALSLVAALKRFSEPVVHELGQLGHSHNYVVLAEQSEAHSVPHLLIVRPEEPLFFGSAERVMTAIQERLDSHPAIQTVVLSLEESADLDSTALECLLELHAHLAQQHCHLVLARVKENVRQLLSHWAPQSVGNPAHMYWSVADAVEAALQLPASPQVV